MRFHSFSKTAILASLSLLAATTLQAGGSPETSVFEIGDDDFRISSMGPDGDDAFDASQASVAYAPTFNEYLVVWSGDTEEGALVEGEREIWGQRLDTATGAPLGSRFRISDMGPDGSTTFQAQSPDVVYNSLAGEYLVVWQGLDDSTTSSGEVEIWGQRIEAGTGAELGANDFRISNQGPDGASNSDASAPAVAYNLIDDEYLVVWHGDGAGSLENDELEVFGQRLEGASGAFVGAEGFRISQMGPDGDADFDAQSADVAHNAIDNEYLVVWSGDTDDALLVNGEFEIWGQVLDGTTGAAIGGDRRLSDMGPDGSIEFDASSPAVAHAETSNLFLVVWSGDDDQDGAADREFEIYGQLVDGGTLAEVGSDFRISEMGPTGNRNFQATAPAVVFVPADQEFQVFWTGDDNASPYLDNDFEIFGQRLDTTGAKIGGDFGISAFGTEGQTAFGADRPAVTAGPGGETFVVFEGDTDDGQRIDGELEIHGQRLLLTATSADLAITLTDAATTADPGGTLTYTLEVTNLESSGEARALVENEPPPTLDCTYTSVAAGGATGNGSGVGDLAETLDLPNGSSVAYTLDCTIDPFATGTIEQTATVVSLSPDSNLANNVAVDGDTVLNTAADLELTVTSGSPGAVPGQLITYKVTVTNNGTAQVDAATVEDLQPAEFEGCAWQCSASAGATCDPAPAGALVDTPDLASGSSVIYIGTCTVSDSIPFESFVYSASITAPVSPLDPILANNDDSVTVFLALFADGFESGNFSAWSSVNQ